MRAQEPVEAKWQLRQLPCAKWRDEKMERWNQESWASSSSSPKTVDNALLRWLRSSFIIINNKKYILWYRKKSPKRIPFNAHTSSTFYPLLQIHLCISAFMYIFIIIFCICLFSGLFGLLQNLCDRIAAVWIFNFFTQSLFFYCFAACCLLMLSDFVCLFNFGN